MVEEPATVAPAFYARRGGVWADWWTVLHPPYTLWNISYAALGAALVASLDWVVLGATVVAFALAVGVAAHALDELNGRPLGTAISARMLRAAATVALLGAVVLGAVTVARSGFVLVPLIVIGSFLVVGYNLELLGGRLHTDLGFALAWGGFPVVVGYVAQRPALSLRSVLSAAAMTLAAIALSAAQRRLSTPARTLRRRTARVVGALTRLDGGQVPLGRTVLLAPLEGALRALCWVPPLLAAALLLAHVNG